VFNTVGPSSLGSQVYNSHHSLLMRRRGLCIIAILSLGGRSCQKELGWFSY
jgi:hypothetical protein